MSIDSHLGDHRSPLSLPQAMDALALNRRHVLIFCLCAVGFMFDSFNFQLLGMVAPSMSKEWE